jgi:hypothetical protein
MRASTGTYAGGFAQGERDAFHDRRKGVVRELRNDPATEEERGYWDAYSPRTATWGAMHTTTRVVEPYQEAA